MLFPGEFDIFFSNLIYLYFLMYSALGAHLYFRSVYIVTIITSPVNEEGIYKWIFLRLQNWKAFIVRFIISYIMDYFMTHAKAKKP